ncbi:uncharacterized protein LOC143357327 [Halictus rubicundus]|uniref:uncharacterized protein LOC143357327 n=1 Tax=Halictus rubicundus TaxID=77578 RepID=UPI004035DD4A
MSFVVKNHLAKKKLKKKSLWDEENMKNAIQKPSTSSAGHISKVILKLSPLPDATKRRTGARARRCERSEILKSSPNKLMTEEKENKKRMTEQIKNSGNKRKTTDEV